METETALGHSKFDIAAMQADRNAGMGVADIAKKHGCSIWSVYNTTEKPTHAAQQNGTSRSDRLARVASIDWVKVKGERNGGATTEKLALKYGVSTSCIFNHTKNSPARVHWTQTPSGKQRMAEVVRERRSNGKTGKRITLKSLPLETESESVQDTFVRATKVLGDLKEAVENLVDYFAAVEKKLGTVLETIRG